MSFNEQEGTCSCTLRRSSITQDIAREVSTTTAYSIGFVVEVVLAERKLTVLRLCCSLIPRTVRALQTLALSGGCALLVRNLQLKWWAMRTMRRVKGGMGYHYA
ncbi:hypothetical protein TIFTF001_042261 [Ficus carica]|uniref:Uncharacterized protein n=1 Tax=Ficus carica TaxID=3494 RepID=A0AA88CXJ7_FICCA|nr:hypothetical protein TIFTF001_042261 [Ficus carica]